jgi:uncharacterized protein (TIGR03382 family)
VTDPSICELRPHEAVVFPSDGATDAPLNLVVRVLTGAAGGLDVVLTRLGDPAPVSSRLSVTRSGFGNVLELRPDVDLAPAAQYLVAVADGRGPVTSARFTTGLSVAEGPPTDHGPVRLEPVAAQDRACCAGDGCREGTRVTVPALPAEALRPQLVLLEIDELYNDACGPAARPVGTVPVVQETSHDRELSAETDLRLAGCYEVTVIDQANRVGQPSGPECTPGFSWRPANQRADCRAGGGCDCQAGAPGGGAALGWLALTVLWLGWRRRQGTAAGRASGPM